MTGVESTSALAEAETLMKDTEQLKKNGGQLMKSSEQLTKNGEQLMKSTEQLTKKTKQLRRDSTDQRMMKDS